LPAQEVKGTHPPDSSHSMNYDDTVKALTYVVERLPKADAKPER
jgi:hypothetical protein